VQRREHDRPDRVLRTTRMGAIGLQRAKSIGRRVGYPVRTMPDPQLSLPDFVPLERMKQRAN
jgi:hypothetical protein